MNHEYFMAEALSLARQAIADGDVPVGCVIVKDGEVIGRGRNRREANGDATAHAEVEAIREACAKLGSWRLHRCALYVTLEPCCMCAGACLNARLDRVVFGAADPGAGFLGSRVDLFGLELPGTEAPRVLGGILEEKCRGLLRDFFAGRRGTEHPQ